MMAKHANFYLLPDLGKCLGLSDDHSSYSMLNSSEYEMLKAKIHKSRDFSSSRTTRLDWPQSLKHLFTHVLFHILVSSLTQMAFI